MFKHVACMYIYYLYLSCTVHKDTRLVLHSIDNTRAMPDVLSWFWMAFVPLLILGFCGLKSRLC